MRKFLTTISLAVMAISVLLAPAAVAAQPLAQPAGGAVQPFDPPVYGYYTSINLYCSVDGQPNYFGYNFHGSDYAPNAYYYFEKSAGVVGARSAAVAQPASASQIHTSANGLWLTDTFYGGQFASGTELEVVLNVFTTPAETQRVASVVKYCRMP